MPLCLGGDGWESDACILPGIYQKNARVMTHERERLLEVILQSFWVGGNYILKRQQPEMEPEHNRTLHKAGECHVCRNVQVYFHQQNSADKICHVSTGLFWSPTVNLWLV